MAKIAWLKIYNDPDMQMIPDWHVLFYRMFGIGLVALLMLPRADAEAQIRYGTSSSVFTGSNGNLPFWFYSNRDGVVDPSSTNMINRFYGTVSERDSTDNLHFSGGVDAYARLSADNTIVFTQLFGKVAYRGLAFSAGRFYDPMGLHDRTLSMGSMLVSRNATPPPKIRIGSDGFVNVPRTGGRLQVNAMLSHGWLTDNRYIGDPYLHQKFLYIKYKHPRFDITAGAAHNAVWGGTHPGFGEGTFALPSSFSDFLDVMLGQSASGNDVPENEITNVVGNSVAAYEVKAGINFEHFRFKAYRLFYLEDKVALQFRSPWDGMWGAGIELENNRGVVTDVLWEHLNTKRQNAWINTSLGRSNYYNNGVYRSGWAYEGRVLGTPLLLNRPTPDFDGGLYPVTNNIIIAHHVGIRGKPTDRLSYKMLLTYSRNYGTSIDQGEGPPYTALDEIRADEFSSLLELSYRAIPEYGLSLTGSFAFDVGELYEKNRLGLQVGVRWDRVID